MFIKLKEMVESERPREKALKYGIEKLSNRELIALLLRCGYKGTSALQLADILIHECQGIANMSKMSLSQFIRIKGISETKAMTFIACFELAKRVSYDNLTKNQCVENPKEIAQYLMQKIGSKQQEHFVVLFLNTKHQILAEETLFVGSLNTSVVHAREIFKAAIMHCSARILIAHNHPSNDCIPSDQDIQVTQQLNEVAQLIGISLLDHIIVGFSSYFSFKENQLL